MAVSAPPRLRTSAPPALRPRAGFAMGDYVGFQQMGFGVGVALLVDATVIRSIILPSAMRLLGRRTWYLPARLRWLPQLQVEGRR